MPLSKIHLTDAASSAFLNQMSLPIPGEMADIDFAGPDGLDHYHPNFEGIPGIGETELVATKSSLADSLAAHLRGPFRLIEEWFTGQPVIDLVVRAPADVEWVRNNLMDRFTYDRSADYKNIREDLRRIDAGYAPAGDRMKRLYDEIKQTRDILKNCTL